MKSLTSRDAAAGATLCSWTGGSVLGTSRKTIPATTMRTMMMNQRVMRVPKFVSHHILAEKAGCRRCRACAGAAYPNLRTGTADRVSPAPGHCQDLTPPSGKAIRSGASDGTPQVLPIRFQKRQAVFRGPEADRKRRGAFPEERTVVT